MISNSTHFRDLKHYDLAVPEFQIYTSNYNLFYHDINGETKSLSESEKDKIIDIYFVFKNLFQLKSDKYLVPQNLMIDYKRVARCKYHPNFYHQDGRRKYKKSNTFNSVLNSIPEKYVLPIVMLSGCVLGLSALPGQLALQEITNQLTKYEFQQLRGCTRLPVIFYRYSQAMFEIKSKFPAFWLDNPFVNLLHTSITENLMINFSFQSVFLKKLPELILGKKIVNHRVAVCSRVALTTLMFVFAHAMPPELESIRGFSSCALSNFAYLSVQGLIMSIIQEATETALQDLTHSNIIALTGSTLASSAYHSVANMPSLILQLLKNS